MNSRDALKLVDDWTKRRNELYAPAKEATDSPDPDSLDALLEQTTRESRSLSEAIKIYREYTDQLFSIYMDDPLMNMNAFFPKLYQLIIQTKGKLSQTSLGQYTEEEQKEILHKAWDYCMKNDK